MTNKITTDITYTREEYKVGDYFQDTDTKSVYILARGKLDGDYMLVNIKSGATYSGVKETIDEALSSIFLSRKRINSGTITIDISNDK